MSLLSDFSPGELFTVRDVVNAAKFPQPSIRRLLSVLTKQGTIQRIEPGLFQIPKGRIEDVKPTQIDTYYLSGLSYNRDIGIKISTEKTISDAEDILRNYARRRVSNFNEEFYGISSIGYNGFDEVGKIIEVNL